MMTDLTHLNEFAYSSNVFNKQNVYHYCLEHNVPIEYFIRYSQEVSLLIQNPFVFDKESVSEFICYNINYLDNLLPFQKVIDLIPPSYYKYLLEYPTVMYSDKQDTLNIITTCVHLIKESEMKISAYHLNDFTKKDYVYLKNLEKETNTTITFKIETNSEFDLIMFRRIPMKILKLFKVQMTYCFPNDYFQDKTKHWSQRVENSGTLYYLNYEYLLNFSVISKHYDGDDLLHSFDSDFSFMPYFLEFMQTFYPKDLTLSLFYCEESVSHDRFSYYKTLTNNVPVSEHVSQYHNRDKLFINFFDLFVEICRVPSDLQKQIMSSFKKNQLSKETSEWYNVLEYMVTHQTIKHDFLVK